MIQVYCEEKGEAILRTIRPMPRDMWSIRDIVRKMREVPNFLGPVDPYSLFSSPLTQMVLIDDVGIVGAMNLLRGQNAHVNMTFWDRRLRGRETLCRVICKWLIDEFELKFLYTGISKDNRVLKAFLDRVGLEKMYEIDEWLIYHYWR